MKTPAQIPATVPNDNWYRLTAEAGGGSNVSVLFESSMRSFSVVTVGDAGREPSVIAGRVTVNHQK